MESVSTYWADRAQLEWQVELGADEAIQDTPVDRYALEVAAAKIVSMGQGAERPPLPVMQEVDAPALARAAAAGAADLAGLAQAQKAFELCELKRGAKNFVFADGQPGARVMILGDAPSRQEDIAGKPFVGQAGALLDKMLAAIGLDRAADNVADAIYVANVVPWRPPSNQSLGASDIAMMLPFLERHIALANPDVVVLMGNTACQALLRRGGITRMRGQWLDVLGRPALAMFHPADLLRRPAAKRDAWADLLSLKAKLREVV